MIYGLYLSATGVLTNSYRQDVIANNLANSETVGFKRSLALFQERRAESQQLGKMNSSNPMLDRMGGGLLAAPTYVDETPGTPERTSNKLDLAIQGRGFFAVQDHDNTRLTRNGQFMLDRKGNLILGNGSGNRVLDVKGKPIVINGAIQSQLEVGNDGTIKAGNEVVGQIGLFDVPDQSLIGRQGGTLLSYPDIKKLKPAGGTLQSGFLETSNVDPMTELTQLINTQRQLEANANMIRFQDQTLGKLVNEVGKVG